MMNISDILETIAMIEEEHLDIRTITMGISLLDCCDSDIRRSCDKVYDKICRYAKDLVKTGEQIEKEFIGKGIPSLYYGITLNLSYKGFDFTTYGSGVSGNGIANCVYGRTRTFTNVIRDLANKKNWTGTGLEFGTDAFVFDGSWFRIKQMQLGYTIPDKITRRIFIQKARLYISLDDWITFSSYPGGDPETATTGSRLSDLGYKEDPSMTSYDGKGQLMGVDYGSYPISKKILFGLSIQF